MVRRTREGVANKRIPTVRARAVAAKQASYWLNSNREYSSLSDNLEGLQMRMQITGNIQ